MNAFSAYILRAHLRPLLYGFALIMFLLVIDLMLQLMDQVLSKGLSSSEAGQLFFYNLAWIVALAVPLAVLVAVLAAKRRATRPSRASSGSPFQKENDFSSKNVEFLAAKLSKHLMSLC